MTFRHRHDTLHAYAHIFIASYFYCNRFNGGTFKLKESYRKRSAKTAKVGRWNLKDGESSGVARIFLTGVTYNKKQEQKLGGGQYKCISKTTFFSSFFLLFF